MTTKNHFEHRNNNNNDGFSCLLKLQLRHKIWPKQTLDKLKEKDRERERETEKEGGLRRGKWNVPRKLRLMKVHALNALIVVVATYWQK